MMHGFFICKKFILSKNECKIICHFTQMNTKHVKSTKQRKQLFTHNKKQLIADNKHKRAKLRE